ncbi:SRPBCC domain-containing protein [Emcibacter nanhaiensis]|uniref:SRPBCC domain-containing protein n=1 Tax=Emcibacter nanhaiensis TaxID=1505037 RepID=A0A501PMJ9_9PROT|nr:SRPBCC domain-containing protein [Emcibacter nanhaiensis]TPD61710.1 SRPBCC domain-containing protein [Emcibacter nanhaiensis]
MKHQISTSIDIKAPPAEVWKILTDFDSWGEWNPFIPRISGDQVKGGKVSASIRTPGGKSISFTATITDYEAEKVLEWYGSPPIPGLFSGRHWYRLEPIDGGTRFSQGEKFNGLLIRLLKKTLDTTVVDGFQQMNEALKTRAEGN